MTETYRCTICGEEKPWKDTYFIKEWGDGKKFDPPLPFCSLYACAQDWSVARQTRINRLQHDTQNPKHDMDTATRAIHEGVRSLRID